MHYRSFERATIFGNKIELSRKNEDVGWTKYERDGRVGERRNCWRRMCQRLIVSWEWTVKKPVCDGERVKKWEVKGHQWREAERGRGMVCGVGRCQSDTIVTGSTVRMPVQGFLYSPTNHQWQVSPQFLNRDPTNTDSWKEKCEIIRFLMWQIFVFGTIDQVHFWQLLLRTKTFHPSNSGRDDIVLWSKWELGDVVHSAIVIDDEDVVLPVTPGSWLAVGHRHHWFHGDHLRWHRDGFLY